VKIVQPLLTLTLLFATAGAAAAEPAALDQAQRKALDSIPNEGTPPPRQHYFRSNEWYQNLLVQPLSGRGGAYVGVGSDQNYTMAAIAGSELLIMIDYDPRIRWVHRIYDVLVRASETPDDLVSRFAEENTERSSALIETAVQSDPEAAEITKHFKKSRKLWHAYLQRVRGDKGKLPVTSWLSVPEYYKHMRGLFNAGRVIARNGDMTAERTVRAAGAAAKELKLPVRIIYFSNAEQFFPYSDSFQANMRALPTDERSVVVRTIHHGKIPNAGPNDWHYVVHEMPDFFARMAAGYRHSFAFVGDLLAGGKKVIGEDGLSVMTGTVPMAKPGAAEAASQAAAKE
jgi:hypothetical protein